MTKNFDQSWDVHINYCAGLSLYDAPRTIWSAKMMVKPDQMLRIIRFLLFNMFFLLVLESRVKHECRRLEGCNIEELWLLL